ncbi:MAG TPA: hypothetical protein VIU12_21195 [Chryseolinea sp.]
MDSNKPEIVERLDILISLMIPRFNKDKYQLKGLPLDVLELCDAEKTVENMVKTLKKSRPLINNALSKLRSQGLIKSISKNSKTYYIRLL